MYDIKTAKGIQDALRDLQGGTIQSMLETELTAQMQERGEADPEYSNSRNGYKPKTLRSNVGEMPISVPQDRNSNFLPQIVPKYKKDISEIEGRVIVICVSAPHVQIQPDRPKGAVYDQCDRKPEQRLP